MEYVTLISNRIRELCKQRGNISFYKLSEMSGVSTSTLENIIKGHTKNPGIATIHQLALGFNMTIAEFCDFDEMNMYEFVEEENEVAGWRRAFNRNPTKRQSFSDCPRLGFFQHAIFFPDLFLQLFFLFLT